MSTTTIKKFSAASLAAKGADLAEVESWIRAHSYRIEDCGDSYDDLLDRLDGSEWSDGSTVDLGGSLADPAYRRLLAIARRVRREAAAA